MIFFVIYVSQETLITMLSFHKSVSQSVSRTMILTIIHVLEFMLSLLQTVDVYVKKAPIILKRIKKPSENCASL